MPYASVSQAVCKLKEGWRAGVEVLAIKLWYYCWSSYNVIHPIKGDILQNPVVIINNHLPQYDAK